MTPSSAEITASIGRKPRDCKARIRKVTTAVSRPASQSGMPNSRLKPIAAPINSARSVAMATSSISTHIPQTTGLGKWSRQSSARLRPVAIPSLADRHWISIAIRLLATTTQSRV